MWRGRERGDAPFCANRFPSLTSLISVWTRSSFSSAANASIGAEGAGERGEGGTCGTADRSRWRVWPGGRQFARKSGRGRDRNLGGGERAL